MLGYARLVGTSLLFALLLLVVVAADEQPHNLRQPLTVICVRHAEKVDGSTDAKLSSVGEQRAQELSRVLQDVELAGVHSTDFSRTRATATPTAKAKGLKVTIYDRYKPDVLVEKLLKHGGKHLVIGHSSSIPLLIKRLGGRFGKRIAVASEFDRMYVIQIDGNHRDTILLRYGKSTLLSRKQAESVAPAVR